MKTKTALALVVLLAVGGGHTRALPYGLDYLESGVSGEVMREIEALRVGGENEVTYLLFPSALIFVLHTNPISYPLPSSPLYFLPKPTSAMFPYSLPLSRKGMCQIEFEQ